MNKKYFLIVTIAATASLSSAMEQNSSVLVHPAKSGMVDQATQTDPSEPHESCTSCKKQTTMSNAQAMLELARLIKGVKSKPCVPEEIMQSSLQ